MDKFVKKNIIDKKREEAVHSKEDEFADFEGSKAELLFLKFSRYLGRNRKTVFISLSVLIVLLISIIGFFEYRDHVFQKQTSALEEIQRKHREKSIPTDAQIADLESFLKNESSGDLNLRVWKDLSRLYAETKNWEKAAEYLEKAGTGIDTPKELKAYYFYIAGNYRDQQTNIPKALEDYKIASTLLDTNTEAKSFKAWSFLHTGRLQFASGDKAGAKLSLEKVLRIDGEGLDDLDEAKLQATYLLLKLGKS